MSDDIYRAIVPTGGHLAETQGVAEEFLGAVLNSSNQLIGQARFVKVDIANAPGAEPTTVPSTTRNVAIGLAAGVLATVVVVKFSPRVKQWWLARGLPKSRSALRRLTRSVETQGAVGEASVGIEVLEPVDFQAEVEQALADEQVSMSSAEAQRHLLAVVMAAAFIAERVRLLSSARIEDGVEFPELHDAMEKLTTQRVADSINLMLEGDHSLLDRSEVDELSRMFGGPADNDLGERVPVGLEDVREALCLTPDEGPAGEPLL